MSQKKLKYVKVYDTLYAGIQEGLYPAGSQLPSEPELAQQMGVSRMTLRQALALLQDDGLLKNIHGKGNFILSRETESVSGLESLLHPVYHCCQEPLDSCELELRIEPPSEYMVQTMECQTPVMVIADRWYRSGERALGYSLSFLPIEVIAREQLDLNYPKQLCDYLNQGIYQTAKSSSVKISFSSSGNFTSGKYLLSEKDIFVLILEFLYDSEGSILAMTKHYLPADICQIGIYGKARQF